MEPEASRLEMGNVLEGINETSLPNNSASGSNRSDLFVPLDLISILSNDVRDLNEKLEGMSKKNEKLLENNYLLKIENLKLREQRNAKAHGRKVMNVPIVLCPVSIVLQFSVLCSYRNTTWIQIMHTFIQNQAMTKLLK